MNGFSNHCNVFLHEGNKNNSSITIENENFQNPQNILSAIINNDIEIRNRKQAQFITEFAYLYDTNTPQCVIAYKLKHSTKICTLFQ